MMGNHRFVQRLSKSRPPEPLGSPRAPNSTRLNSKGPESSEGSGRKSSNSNRNWGPKLGQAKPNKYPAQYPNTGTQRFRTILGRFRRVSTTIRNFRKGEIAQPSYGQGIHPPPPPGGFSKPPSGLQTRSLAKQRPAWRRRITARPQQGRIFIQHHRSGHAFAQDLPTL